MKISWQSAAVQVCASWLLVLLAYLVALTAVPNDGAAFRPQQHDIFYTGDKETDAKFSAATLAMAKSVFVNMLNQEVAKKPSRRCNLQAELSGLPRIAIRAVGSSCDIELASLLSRFDPQPQRITAEMSRVRKLATVFDQVTGVKSLFYIASARTTLKEFYLDNLQLTLANFDLGEMVAAASDDAVVDWFSSRPWRQIEQQNSSEETAPTDVDSSVQEVFLSPNDGSSHPILLWGVPTSKGNDLNALAQTMCAAETNLFCVVNPFEVPHWWVITTIDPSATGFERDGAVRRLRYFRDEIFRKYSIASSLQQRPRTILAVPR